MPAHLSIFLHPRSLLLLLTLFSATLIISAFVLEHGFGVLPCQMCWWQRYAHMAIFAISIASLFTFRLSTYPIIRVSALTILLVSLIGLAIAIWQFSAQQGWLPFPASCTSHGLALEADATNLMAAMNQTKVVPCDLETFKILGLSLAGWNIPAMLLTLTLAIIALKNK